MADSKISALTDGNPAQSGDEIPIARGGANYKITAGSIASLSGNGDVVGPASSTDSQIALFNSTTGKLIKAATTTGVLKASSGVIAAATSGTDYVAPAGAFSGLSWQSVQTTGFTAVAFRAYPCNTTSAAFTVTLPASPSAGDQITLTDYAGTWGTNAVTVSPNGNKIQGGTGNAVLVTNRGSVQLVYVDSTQGWLAYSGFAVASLFIPIDYLIVAGGAGGGSGIGGAGGAGGYRTGSGLALTAGNTYNITVGSGGAGGAAGTSQAGADGGNSSLDQSGGGLSITAVGGGGGGNGANFAGRTGGSGGGGGYGFSGGAASTSPSGQGNAGGAGATAPSYGGGGGGGAGTSQTGATGGTNGGNGGNGVSSSISGTATTYAGGGGGGATSQLNPGAVAGTGGTGGGANGSNTNATPTAAPVNLGGGGGGGGYSSSSVGAGGTGGSGVVIISYPSIYPAATSTTGSPTVVISGNNRIYTFTGNGSITF